MFSGVIKWEHWPEMDKARHCSDVVLFIIHQVQTKKGEHLNGSIITELEVKVWPQLLNEIKFVTCHEISRRVEKKVLQRSTHLMGNREGQTSSHYSLIIFISRKFNNDK